MAIFVKESITPQQQQERQLLSRVNFIFWEGQKKIKKRGRRVNELIYGRVPETLRGGTLLAHRARARGPRCIHLAAEDPAAVAVAYFPFAEITRHDAGASRCVRDVVSG